MVINLEELKPICSKILFALDPTSTTELSDVLQIRAEGTLVKLCVTNGEYFVEISLPSANIASFNATVAADAFLKLIPLFTKEEVDLCIEKNALKINCDGKYKLPLIYEDDKLLELPEIQISNITNQFTIETTILKSILDYNSREFSKGKAVRPVQTLYYIDNKGALTFTTGACINTFSLPEDIKILLPQKLVRLFKLFDDDTVMLSLGQDNLSPEIQQTKIQLKSSNITITAKINCDEKLFKSFPVDAIRTRAQANYNYNISINRLNLIKALNRLNVLDKGKEPICSLHFAKNAVCISNKVAFSNTEEILYEAGEANIDPPYETKLNLKDFKTTLENCSEQFIVLSFGNHEALAITKGNILTLLPEIYG